MLKRAEYDPARYPEVLRYEDEVGEARLGEALTIVSHPFATPVDNEALLKLALENGLPPGQTKQAEQVIAATGFTKRYLSRFPDQDFDLETTLDRTTTIGALLLRRLMASKGWDDLDVFVDTSAFLPLSINRRILEKAGLDPDRVISRSDRFACAGAIAALGDILADQSLAQARVAIGALEPLSQTLSRRLFNTLDYLATPSIFGDDYAFAAVDPSRFQLQNLQTLVQPDHGVIKLRTLYDFASFQARPGQIPPHYRFGPGGREIFKYSPYGAILDIEPPGADITVLMNGVETGLFFGNQTSALIIEILKEYGNLNLLRELGSENLIMHPASEPVVNLIAKKLQRAGFLDVRTLPFHMKSIGRSNSSSATTLVSLEHQINLGLINPQKPLLWVAPGIGSVITAGIGWVNP